METVAAGRDVADLQGNKGRQRTAKGGRDDGITDILWQRSGQTIGCGKYRANYVGSDMVSHPGRTDM